MGTIKTDNITGRLGSTASAPITLSGDAATFGDINMSSGKSIKNAAGTDLLTEAGVLGSSVVFPNGHVLQVVCTQLNTVDSVTTDAYVVKISRAITPTDVNSHFLVTYTGQAIGDAVGLRIAITGTANATDISVISPINTSTPVGSRSLGTMGGHGTGTQYMAIPFSYMFIHDPALPNLNEIFYNVAFSEEGGGGTVYINKAYGINNNAAYMLDTVSTLTVFELGRSS